MPQVLRFDVQVDSHSWPGGYRFFHAINSSCHYIGKDPVLLYGVPLQNICAEVVNHFIAIHPVQKEASSPFGSSIIILDANIGIESDRI